MRVGKLVKRVGGRQGVGCHHAPLMSHHQVCVYKLDDCSLVRSFKAHGDTVDTLAAVGMQVCVCVCG